MEHPTTNPTTDIAADTIADTIADTAALPSKTTTACRDCSKEVSLSAWKCPSCGAPRPYEAEFSGYGYEWKSKQSLLGLPLVHVSLKYSKNRRPVVATGWLAIGQFSSLPENCFARSLLR